MRAQLSLRARIAATCGVTAAIIGFVLVLIASRGAVPLAIGLGAAGGIVGALCGLLAARFATAPLRALSAATQAAANGRPEAVQTWQHAGGDLADLASAVDELAKELHAKELHATEQRDTLAELITAMADGVVFIDIAGSIRLINPAGRPLLH